jgi:hypothetical protein
LLRLPGGEGNFLQGLQSLKKKKKSAVEKNVTSAKDKKITFFIGDQLKKI